jgi:hypothetical protein
LGGIRFGSRKDEGPAGINAQGQLLDHDQIILTPPMQMLSVDAAGIDRVKNVGGAQIFVVDDLHAS